MRVPRAFTIVELITAMVVLAVGIAAAARAAAAIARLERDAQLRRTVAATVLARLDSLVPRACGESSAGDATHDGVRERWRTASVDRHFQLDLSVDATVRPSLSRHLVIDVPCRP